MRTYYKWGDWGSVEKVTGLKSNRKKNVNEQKRSAQREKFAKCRECGAQMVYVPGTNILVCENEVEKKITKDNPDGTKTEKVTTARCGCMNLVDDQYTGYLNYLFEEAK